jgi:hypothetical protein
MTLDDHRELAGQWDHRRATGSLRALAADGAVVEAVAALHAPVEVPAQHTRDASDDAAGANPFAEVRRAFRTPVMHAATL